MERIADGRRMRAWAEAERRAGHRIVLVPTMGALHDGHLALVARAAELGDRVVVSIFVNPIQFERPDDFQGYPCDLEGDAALLRQAAVAVLFAPDAAVMYPPGFQTHVEVERVTRPLCGAHRPGHFRGVATVVTKLFHLVHPHVAVFGEKDYQQLVAIRRLAADLEFGIDVVGVETVREPDGLAMSSRNRRLGRQARAAALCVPRALRAAREAAAGGERIVSRLVAAVRGEIDREPLARLEYAEIRDAGSLEEMEVVDGVARFALAVWIDGVRLIDNCVIEVAAADAADVVRGEPATVGGSLT